MEMVDPLDIRHGNKILLFLLEKGEIKKIDLLEIMSSSDSLSRILQDLINSGLIESETIIQGRKVILTKLTPLGRKVAEQLKKVKDILEDYNKNQKGESSNGNNIGGKCPVCGYENFRKGKFCMECGVKLG